MAGFSKYHFSRLFKKYVGMSPYTYLLRFRLRRAVEQISSTNKPVKQVAFMVGFNDYPYFCNMFKKHTGFTPAAVRRQRARFRTAGHYNSGGLPVR